MSSLMPFTLLSEVKPFKCGWKVQVKVLHSWKQYNSVSRETLEMILSDERRCKIHASCKKAYLESKGRLLPVGAGRNIQNFSLSPATGMYRSTEHSYKMSFVHNTTITRSNHVNEDTFLSLVDFQLVMSGSLQQCFLIDVIGQVVELRDLETIQVSGKPRRKLEFHLRDIKSDPSNLY
ncbi:hypothetical protein Bca4012_010189 [Brassica carinata]